MATANATSNQINSHSISETKEVIPHRGDFGRLPLLV
jgi:hypothetical protein